MPKKYRITDVTEYGEYQLLDQWIHSFHENDCLSGALLDTVVLATDLIRACKDYQEAKKMLFQEDFYGKLPLVTRALRAQVCGAYDRLLALCRRDNIPDVSFELSLPGVPGAKRTISFAQLLESVLQKVRAEDGASVAFLRGYQPSSGEKANILEYGDVYRAQREGAPNPYPFYKEKTYEQLYDWDDPDLVDAREDLGGCDLDNVSVNPKNKMELFDVSAAEKAALRQKTLDFFFTKDEQVRFYTNISEILPRKNRNIDTQSKRFEKKQGTGANLRSKVKIPVKPLKTIPSKEQAAIRSSNQIPKKILPKPTYIKRVAHKPLKSCFALPQREIVSPNKKSKLPQNLDTSWIFQNPKRNRTKK